MDANFYLVYQPQFLLENNRYIISGVEALLRTKDPACDLSQFLKDSAESGEIISVGYWIIEKAIIDLKKWINKKIINLSFKMSVNISLIQLQDDNFCSTIFNLLEKHHINTNQLVLEITETSTLREANIDKIHQLAEKGIGISLDDFGTGYSSLWRLKVLPISEIKIDKIFVDDVTKSHQDIALLTAMHQLTVALQKFTIVEGVETKKQLIELLNIGFKCFQGYYFAEPEPADEIINTIKVVNSLHCQTNL